MKHKIWFGFGLAILIVAYVVRAGADPEANAGEQMSYDVLYFFVMAGAIFCFFMGFQAAMKLFREHQESERMKSIRNPHMSIDPLDNTSPKSAFDADAALARYMENRKTEPTGTKPLETDNNIKSSGFGRKS